MSEFVKIILEWITPSGIVIIIGFIIWLVQLNHWVISLKKESGVTTVRVGKLEDAMEVLANNNTKISTILEYMSEDVKETKQDISELRKDIQKVYKV